MSARESKKISRWFSSRRRTKTTHFTTTKRTLEACWRLTRWVRFRRLNKSGWSKRESWSSCRFYGKLTTVLIWVQVWQRSGWTYECWAKRMSWVWSDNCKGIPRFYFSPPLQRGSAATLRFGGRKKGTSDFQPAKGSKNFTGQAERKIEGLL